MRHDAGAASQSIVDATRSYESWMARQTTVVRGDLRHKHARLAESAFVFLRGTYYRWAQMWPAVCRELADAPAVLAVGDLHVENFGTWRDEEGRLVWGINDFDEASPLPYTNDLVRLATSAVLAASNRRMTIPVRQICASILEGYAASLQHGGRPIVLAERHTWLRAIALEQLKDPGSFWAKIAANPAAPQTSGALRRLLGLPAGATDVRMLRRQAGVGSLGRLRVVALAMHDGGLIAREAKAIVPPAAAWVTGRTMRSYSVGVSRGAVRAHDPFFRGDSRWTVRRLSPDCSKIELSALPRLHNDGRMLRAMGWDTANVHLGTTRSSIARDLARRPVRWLERATTVMVDAVTADYRAWSRAQRLAARVV